MPDCGAVSMLMGTKTLNELEAKMDFGKHKLRVKSRKIRVKCTKKLILQPHEKSEITLFSHGPGVMKNAPAVVNFSSFMRNFTVPTGIVQFHRGKCRVPVYNNTDRPIHIEKSSTLGNIDMDSSFCVLRQAPVYPPGGGAGTKRRPIMQRRHLVVGMNLRAEQLYSATHSGSSVDRSNLKRDKMSLYKHLEPDDPRLHMTDKEIIDQFVDLNPKDTHLPPEEIDDFRQFLYKNKTAFSLHDEIGDSGEVVDFQLVKDTPFFIRPYSCSEADKILIDKYMQKLGDSETWYVRLHITHITCR